MTPASPYWNPNTGTLVPRQSEDVYLTRSKIIPSLTVGVRLLDEPRPSGRGFLVTPSNVY